MLVAVPAMAILALLSTWWAVENRALPPDDDRLRWQVVLGWLGAIGADIGLASAQGVAMAIDHPVARLVAALPAHRAARYPQPPSCEPSDERPRAGSGRGVGTEGDLRDGSWLSRLPAGN